MGVGADGIGRRGTLGRGTRRAATSTNIPGLAGFFHQIDVRSRGDLAYSSPVFLSFFSRCARISTNLQRHVTTSCTIFRRTSCTLFKRGPRQSRRNHCTPSSLCIAFRRVPLADQPACAPRPPQGKGGGGRYLAHLALSGAIWLSHSISFYFVSTPRAALQAASVAVQAFESHMRRADLWDSTPALTSATSQHQPRPASKRPQSSTA